MSDRAVTNLIGRILVCQSLRTEIAAGRQFAEPKAQSSLIASPCNSRLRGASRCTSGRRGLFGAGVGRRCAKMSNGFFLNDLSVLKNILSLTAASLVAALEWRLVAKT
jgi:hypothetical protein